MEINIPDLERHQLATAGQSFIGNAEHCPLAVRAKALASALNEILDVFPTEGMRLVLARRGFASHFLQTQTDSLTRARIQQLGGDVHAGNGRYVALDGRRLLAVPHAVLDERPNGLRIRG